MMVERFDKGVFDRGGDIGESPGHAAIMSDNYEGIPGKSHTGHVEIARVQVGLVPKVGHLMAEVHIVREQRLAGDRVRSRHYPIVLANPDRFLPTERLQPSPNP